MGCGRKTMKANRFWMIAGLALATVASVPAFAQDRDRDGYRDGWYQNRDYDHDRDDWNRGKGRWNNNPAYRKGYEDAVRDRQRNHKYNAKPWNYRRDDERQAYQ